MRFNIEILGQVSRLSGEPTSADPQHFINHLDRVMEGLIEAGAEDPAVDSNIEAGTVEITFALVADSDTEMFEKAIHIFRTALENSGALVDEITLDSITKKDLVPA